MSMSVGLAEPGDRFAVLAAAFADRPGVALPGQGRGRGFGSRALRVHGSVFAMLDDGRLVLKLPRDRVSALVASGLGAPYDGGKGRPMAEWVAVEADDDVWRDLAEEALAFVAGTRGRRR